MGDVTVHDVSRAPPSTRRGWRRRLRWTRRLARVSKYSLGVLLILCVTVIWVAASEWIQYIFHDLDYNKPYFLTYFNTTGFCLWNVCYLFMPRWRVPWSDSTAAQPILIEDTALLAGDVDGGDDADARLHIGDLTCKKCVEAKRSALLSTSSPSLSLAATTAAACTRTTTTLLPVCEPAAEQTAHMAAATKRVANRDDDDDDVAAVADVQPARYTGGIAAMGGAPRPLCLPKRSKMLRLYSLSRIWRCATLFCIFWFLANTLFNFSLTRTSVASNTTLSATSSVWTLLLSLLLPNTRIGPLKWVAVAVSLGGSIMMALSDSNNRGGDTVTGDVLAILSALFYAVYTSILRLCLPDDNRYAMGMVFGAVGVVNVLFLWPGMLVLHAIGVEPFAMPTPRQFWPLVLNALIGTNLSDVLWARSVILTSPVVATIGLSLSTPLAMVVDAVLHHQTYTPLYIVGAICIMVGFIVANLPYFE